MKLAVLKGFRDENTVTISCLPYSIGRCRSANFIIAHVNVSRNHCEIVKESGEWKINDHSSSGTYVNDVLVGKGNSLILNNGDSIRFGPVESNLCWSFFSTLEHILETQVDCDLTSVKNSEENELACEKPEIQFKDVQDSQSSNGKSESEKIKELTKELKQVQSALNDLEEKNCALQGELSTGATIKTETTTLPSKLLENLTDLMEAEFQCTICSELFVTAVMLSCAHMFCKYCINQWKKKQKTCPICRKKITNETRSLVVDNYIDKMVGNLSLELKERREAVIKERTEIEPVRKRSKLKNKNS